MLNDPYFGRSEGQCIFDTLEKLSKDEDENTVTEQSHPLKDYINAGSKPLPRTEINSLEGDVVLPENLVTVDYFFDSMVANRENNIRKLMKQAKQSIESIDKGSIVPEWYEGPDIKPYIEILSGDNPNIFVSMIALQGKDEMTNEPKEKVAVLMYNKKAFLYL